MVPCDLQKVCNWVYSPNEHRFPPSMARTNGTRCERPSIPRQWKERYIADISQEITQETNKILFSSTPRTKQSQESRRLIFRFITSLLIAFCRRECKLFVLSRERMIKSYTTYSFILDINCFDLFECAVKKSWTWQLECRERTGSVCYANNN